MKKPVGFRFNMLYADTQKDNETYYVSFALTFYISLFNFIITIGDKIKIMSIEYSNIQNFTYVELENLFYWLSGHRENIPISLSLL